MSLSEKERQGFSAQVAAMPEPICLMESKATPLETPPYETACFHQCWWEFLAPKFDIPVKFGDLLIRRRPVLRGMFKLKEARIAGWNNAWDQYLTEARADELDTLAHTSRWDCFRMVWKEEGRSRQAFERLTEKGYLMLQLPAPTQYGVDLSNGFEAYLKGLSHNSRKSLNKKARRGEPLKPTLVLCENETEVESFFTEFFQHHLAYWDEKTGHSYFHDLEERNFILNWTKALARSDGEFGQPVVDRLLMGGKTVNLSMGVRTGNAFHWLLTINTGLYAEYAPGIIGLRMRLERLANQGVTRFLMGAGDYFYKMQAANIQEPCRELLICNPHSLAGRLYFRLISMRQQAPNGA